MTCIKNIFTRTLLLTTGIALLVPAHASLATETKAVSVDEIKVTSTRITESIMGKSATIITAEEIERSAGKTLPEILAIEAGINFTDFYGGASGARQRIDIRGFGETSTENTLILLNGRRLSDLDLAAVNFSAIPVDNIKQIEILRGSQGAVLYGGGSQGGAINIITKSAVVQGTHGNLKISRGSDAYQKGSFTATQGVDNYSASLFGQFVNSDGYRDNNVLMQRNITTEFRREGELGDVYLRFDNDKQHLGLPADRDINLNTGINEVLSDPRGADQLEDYGDQKGYGVTVGGTYEASDNVEYIVDASMRYKDQDSVLSGRTTDTELSTYGLTPRVNIETEISGLAVSSTNGIDGYYVDYKTDWSEFGTDARVNANQLAMAVYSQNTLELSPQLDLIAGVRVERVTFSAGQEEGWSAKSPKHDLAIEYAWDIGFDYDFEGPFSSYGHLGRGYRVPTLDERVATGTAFELANQTSKEIEAGVRYGDESLSVDARTFFMKTKNEIRFNPGDLSGSSFGTNENTDPIHRYGLELSTNKKVTDSFSVKGNLTLLRAVYAEGSFKGNDVPLVPNITFSTGGAWKINDFLTVDTTLTFEDERRLGNDQGQNFPELSRFFLWDAKISGQYDAFDWSLAVNNILAKEYQTLGWASATTAGVYNVYTLPGRTFMFNMGVTF